MNVDENKFLLAMNQQPFVLRVNNGKHEPAYIRLFDPTWSKAGCTIDSPAMQDPTIGRLVNFQELTKELLETHPHYVRLSVWCPNIPMNLDLFTMHLYENIGDNADLFQNMRILFPVLDEYQVQGSVLGYPCDLNLTGASRLSFLMPAMSTALFYFWPQEQRNP